MENKAAQLNGTICKNGELGHVAIRVHIKQDIKTTQSHKANHIAAFNQ